MEVNPVWQQKKLVEFCKGNGILVVAYAALGAVGTFYGTNRVMESATLKEIAKARGKTVAQVFSDLVFSGLFVFFRFECFLSDQSPEKLEKFKSFLLKRS